MAGFTVCSIPTSGDTLLRLKSQGVGRSQEEVLDYKKV